MIPHTPALQFVLLIAIAAALLALEPRETFAAKRSVLEIPVASVDKALSADRLRSAADQTNDPDVLLGLLYLSRDVDPGFTAIAEKLLKAKPDYAGPAAIVRAIVADADEESVAELITRDADNALGYYLKAHALYRADRDKDALAAYQEGAQRREMRLYQLKTSAALFKALTALKLEGRERLCALSWVATRDFNFGVGQAQELSKDLAEIARRSPADQREGLSDLLLVLAGQLYTTSVDNRRYGDRALESAFRIKAELAAQQNSPKMAGYAAVTQALVSTIISTPGDQYARDAVWFFPTRVYHAFYVSAPPRTGAPAAPKGPVFEAEQKAAEALINAAAADPDGTVGAYLKGLMPSKHAEKTPWTFHWSYVDKLTSDSPQLFTVATEYEKAMQAAQQAQHNDPPSKNMSQMMLAGQDAIGYAFNHENTFADSFQTLIDKKAMDPDTSIKSLLSGRPYVFAAAGERAPEKQKDRNRFIVLYDDQPIGDQFQCILADGHGEYIPVERVKAQLKSRGK